MLRPMGMPEDVNVIAWGLSLERPTMILYGIDNIRDLFGHKASVDWQGVTGGVWTGGGIRVRSGIGCGLVGRRGLQAVHHFDCTS
jgi:hypothetical protein